MLQLREGAALERTPAAGPRTVPLTPQRTAGLGVTLPRQVGAEGRPKSLCGHLLPERLK